MEGHFHVSFQLNIGRLDTGVSWFPKSFFFNGQFHVRFAFQILGTTCWNTHTSILDKGDFEFLPGGLSVSLCQVKVLSYGLWRFCFLESKRCSDWDCISARGIWEGKKADSRCSMLVVHVAGKLIYDGLNWPHRVPCLRNCQGEKGYVSDFGSFWFIWDASQNLVRKMSILSSFFLELVILLSHSSMLATDLWTC